ncbi:hypothetical protein [Chryseobacterium sp.]|uniref:hypothetical protein n=1 Tax=Chryseobacterium sp. TaxID=1871047 RepID=UPI0025C69FA3|nr:hypothetical protein [Chryseobacterium sp.]
MSRIRIVKGKYTKITGGDHYMFSDGNIISSAGGKYEEQGNEGGIVFGDSKPYEPWKSYLRHDWYHCVFAHTTNKKIPIADLGVSNFNVEMCLTGITSVIRFEAYNLNSTDKYKFHNWVYLLNIYMNNRGELVEGGMDLITYKTERKIGSQERNIEQQKGSDKIVFQRTQYDLRSKGKDLHDEVLLDHKLIFSNGMERNINFGTKTTESHMFYDIFGDFVKEASRLNRRADISYVFAGTENAESFLSKVNETADKIALETDSPFLASSFDKYKGTSVFKEVFGVLSYLTGTIDDGQVLADRVRKIRGPIQLTSVQCARMDEKEKFIKFSEDKIYFVTSEFEELGEILQKTKKRLKKDE